ncbi:cytochrome P450 like protein [Zymoseptoria brevis]|uniref:Cytochrome P450 like protein n=1 Tax=Zymoseptoria brevis TaxID=1047168 RepID=A0A0F4GJ05_9PEZI|nr:cytochrome P450 like protein [Zymoseptoria brevis]
MAASAVVEWIHEMLIAHVPFSVLIIWTIGYLSLHIYLDPLQSIPGPLICRLTPLWSWYHSILGDESHQIDILHERYGPIVRISPDQVVIADGRAMAQIYSEKGGFLKAPFYENFDAEEHQAIFSARDPAYRGVRSRAVGQMFGVGAVKGERARIQGCVDAFVWRLKEKAAKKPARVDVLSLARGLAINVVGAYLFGEEYGDLSGGTTMQSAGAYVDFIVHVGRLFFLPPWLFQRLLAFLRYFRPMAPETEKGMAKVDSFTRRLAEKAIDENDHTYQSRLLKAGISVAETNVQMKDVVFAGTDTTALNLSNIIWNLAKHPDVYAKLQAELAQCADDDLSYDAQRYSYLDGIIREGLRTLRANPTRFPRQVPPGGYTYISPCGRTYHLPSGTIVGLSPSTLHFNPAVFPDPQSFQPQRWLNPSSEMLRDWIPFGIGPRQCIARNLAVIELELAVKAIVRSGVLNNAKPVVENIEIMEWFNARIVGGKVELAWT